MGPAVPPLQLQLADQCAAAADVAAAAGAEADAQAQADDDDGAEEDAQEMEAEAPKYEWARKGWSAVLQVCTRDEGWDKWGFFLMVRDAPASVGGSSGSGITEFAIAKYQEGSYYSSLDGMETDEQGWVWRGGLAELQQLVDVGCPRDPRFPLRALDPADKEYSGWMELHAGVRAWLAQGRPLWKGRWMRLHTGCSAPQRQHWQSHKV